MYLSRMIGLSINFKICLDLTMFNSNGRNASTFFNVENEENVVVNDFNDEEDWGDYDVEKVKLKPNGEEGEMQDDEALYETLYVRRAINKHFKLTRRSAPRALLLALLKLRSSDPHSLPNLRPTPPPPLQTRKYLHLRLRLLPNPLRPNLLPVQNPQVAVRRGVRTRGRPVGWESRRKTNLRVQLHGRQRNKNNTSPLLDP